MVGTTATYQDWQDWARHYVKTMGIARFAVGIVTNTCRRVTLRVEERDSAGDWDETDDARFVGVFDAYRNERQEASELVGMHAHHYQVAGECAQVIVDGPNGLDWGIYSLRAIDFDKPKKGLATVKLTPNGSTRAGTAFVVPRTQVVRFWRPDEEWQGFATSPMSASIDELHRYHSLARSVRRTADSRLVMNGVWFTPGEAHESVPDETEAAGSVNTPASQLDKDWRDIAMRAYKNDDDVWAVAPFPMHYDTNGGTIPKPEWIPVGRDLDAHVLEHMKAALEDFARGLDMPTSIAVAGGPSGDANHWTEWLVDDKYFDSGVAPTLDRITHQDMTQTFLRPVTRMYRLPEERFRVGYDAASVVVKPDQSDLALRLHLAGLLGDDATIEAGNFDLSDKMSPAEFARLLELLSKGAAGDAPPARIDVRTDGRALDTGAPAGPANTVDAPPSVPPAITAAAPAAAPVVSPSTTQRALRQLQQLRRDLGRELLSAAETAFAEAIRHAGVKVTNRAKNRTSGDTLANALAAVDAGGALGPHLAAVGITEAELIDQRFDTYQRQVRVKLDQFARRQRRVLEDAGMDAPPARNDDQRNNMAAVFIATALGALARDRLVTGPLAATPGEVTGAVPARLVTSTIAIASGTAEPQLAAGADQMPTVHPIFDAPQLDRLVVDELDGVDTPIEYEWAWGFYGDPVRPFEPHEDLGMSGFTTTLPGPPYTDEIDPALQTDERGAWVDGDYYQPQDHDGCTCAWVSATGVESGPGTRPIEFPT